MSEVKYPVGDYVYEYHTPYDSGEDETLAHPVVKITPKLVYVQLCWKKRAKPITFSRQALEQLGRDFNKAHGIEVCTRPENHWPIAVISIDKQRQLTAENAGV